MDVLLEQGQLDLLQELADKEILIQSIRWRQRSPKARKEKVMQVRTK